MHRKELFHVRRMIIFGYATSYLLTVESYSLRIYRNMGACDQSVPCIAILIDLLILSVELIGSKAQKGFSL